MEVPERSSSSTLADIQRQWQEMAEAATKPWQEVAEAFSQPWRELAESLGSQPDFERLGGQVWETLTASFSALAEQQEQIAEAVFEAIRAGAEQLQKTMEPIVDQLSSFGNFGGGGGGGAGGSASAPAKAAKATVPAHATEKPAAKAAKCAK